MKIIENEKMNQDTVTRYLFNRLRTACENSQNENIRAHSYIDDLVFLGDALQNITESQQSVCEAIDRLEEDSHRAALDNLKTAQDNLIAASIRTRTEIINIFNELFQDIAEFTYDEEITDEELTSTIRTLNKLRNKHLPTLPCEF